MVLVHIVLGIFVLVGAESLSLPGWLEPSYVLLFIFLLLNIIYDRAFQLQAVRHYWSLKKIPAFFAAVIFGVFIALFPILFTTATGGTVSYTYALSVKSIFITLTIAGWEELWFRGVVLNYANKNVPAILLSALMGILFCFVHLFNPEFSLVDKGPALFGAGALLTILYFYYGNIWVPLGVHFGNNYTNRLISTANDEPDGYISAVLLVGLFIIFCSKTMKRKQAK